MTAAATGQPLLTVDHLTMRFGGLVAIDDVSFVAQPREITAIIGPNGAGKTTVFNCLTGFYKPTEGMLTLSRGGHRYLLERMEGHDIASHAGIARTFQNIRLFSNMSVLENLLVAQHRALMSLSVGSLLGITHAGAGTDPDAARDGKLVERLVMRGPLSTFAGLFGLPAFRHAERSAIDTARQWLDRVGLTRRADEDAGNLPYGDQRRLEIARAMCSNPVLLCLDEPAAGLNPRETHDLNELITGIRDDFGIGILLIEHDMSVVMQISDHVVVLDYGRKISDGTPAEVRADPAVIRAYLGEEEDEEPPSRATAGS